MAQEDFQVLAAKLQEEHLSKSFEIIDDNMVVEKDIFSTPCVNTTAAHGRHIAYIQMSRVAGLSKLAITVEKFILKTQEIQEQLISKWPMP